MSNESDPSQSDRNEAAAAIARGQGFYDSGEPLEPESFDDCRYDAGAAEYLVLTDSEADDRAADYIAESLWAFQADFLSSYMPEGIDSEEIEAIRGDRCESANAAMRALVDAGPYSFGDLVTEAIGADGRGHFLSGYDGEEIEAEIAGRDWYGYRQ